MQKININEQFKSLIPPLAPEELKQLEVNILAEGIREKLVIAVYPDADTGEELRFLADGHNRLAIAEKHGLTVSTIDIYFHSEIDVKLWMIHNQLGRRNLNDFCRTEIALHLEPLLAEQAKERQGKRTDLAPNIPVKLPECSKETREVIADAAGVSGKTVSKVKNILKHPEIAAGVRLGNISINEGYKQVKTEEKKTEKNLLERLSDALEVEKIETIAEAQPVKVGEWYNIGPHRIYCGSNTDSAFTSELKKCAFAFADPPYNADAAEWDNGHKWETDYLVDFAEIVAVTPGISAVPDFFRATAMPYKWSMSAHISNGMTRGALGFGNWIYVALFSKSKSIHKNAQDILTLSIKTSENDGHYHKGRKPSLFMLQMINLFTRENDTVIDPFLGSGSTLFACDKLGRKCIGAEISPEFVSRIIENYAN